MFAVVLDVSPIALMLVTGLFVAVTPWLMPKRECFSVTVPETAWADPRICALRRSFTVRTCALTAGLSLFCGVLFLLMNAEVLPQGLVLVVYAVAATALAAVPYVWMLGFRNQVRRIKRAESWSPAPEATGSRLAVESTGRLFARDGLEAAELAGARRPHVVASQEIAEVPRALSLWWNALYVPVVLLVLILGCAGYAQMPDQVPLNMDFNGNVTNYAPKSLKLVMFPVGLAVFMGACFLLSHWMIVRSKTGVAIERSAARAWAYGVFCHAQSRFLVLGGVGFTAVLTVAMQLNFIGRIGTGAVLGVILAATFVLLAGAIWVSVKYGQNGSKLLAKMEASDSISFDDDENWKLGVFYYDPEDPAIVVPARFGVGWTMNLARPAVWAVMAGVLVVTVVFCAWSILSL